MISVLLALLHSVTIISLMRLLAVHHTSNNIHHLPEHALQLMLYSCCQHCFGLSATDTSQGAGMLPLEIPLSQMEQCHF